MNFMRSLVFCGKIGNIPASVGGQIGKRLNDGNQLPPRQRSPVNSITGRFWGDKDSGLPSSL